MRRALSCSLLAAFLVLPFFGQTAQWKQYKDTTGNFTALFPGDPQDSINKSDDDIQSHTLLAIQQPFYYTVIYTAMKSDQKVDNETYEVFKNAVFKELPNCEVATVRPPAPALSGYVGHWYHLNCDMPNAKVTILGNLYWGKHYAYAVMVMFPSSAAEPQAAGKFLESFGVLDQGK
jgi:hypothetical protein